MAAKCIKALTFGCLNYGPDWRYLLCVADAASILEFGNLVLVKSLPVDRAVLLPISPCPPPWGATTWLKCIIMVPIVVASIHDKAR